ncbi:hypothetical protein NQ315_000481 [Exocentrus adspersus]|uniref:Chitin-binding type-4 domain-containing protein n=1 Tax=Exocentrus adspersus TaxID=1586481 RepID=A0AAV8VEW4_9CUCU|nr:hypothetical protein NQ315_000481 [Exocentrus adspersus]
MNTCLLLFVAAVIAREVVGHGMMLEPPGRSSMWRFNIPGVEPNYYDTGNHCGNFDLQYSLGMKCGVCGDAWTDPVPRDNENTGKYGRGIVVKTYQAGSVIETKVNITANHYGTFTYSLCVLSNPNAPEPGEECFQSLTFEDGSSVWTIPTKDESFQVSNRVKLPPGLMCDRCVLRWQWLVANNYGQCDDGTMAAGCGDRETFRSCADIAIV